VKLEVSEQGNILLKEVYNPVVFETEGGQSLSVCMRDQGFDININGTWFHAVDNDIVCCTASEAKRC